VVVGGTDCAVATQEAAPGALLAAEANGAVEQPGGEPLEPDRDLVERPPQARDDAIDQAAADERLADDDLLRPVDPVREQVSDRDGQVMVRVHQPQGPGDDPVAAGVRGGAEGQVRTGLELHQAGPGEGAGAGPAGPRVVGPGGD